MKMQIDEMPDVPFKIKGPNWWDLWTVYAIDTCPVGGATTVHIKKPGCGFGGAPSLRMLSWQTFNDMLASGEWTVR